LLIAEVLYCVYESGWVCHELRIPTFVWLVKYIFTTLFALESMRCVLRGLDKIFERVGEVGVCGSHPSGDKTAARMGHPGFLPVLKRTRAKATTTAGPSAALRMTVFVALYSG
jgi:hypothetical protein